MSKRAFHASQQSQQRSYRLLTASISPRMVGWVSTRSASGVDNLAPYSSFAIVSTAPPMVGFTSFGVKDTLRNILDTGEYTVTVGTGEYVEELNQTATGFEADCSEYVERGVASEPSECVAPVRPIVARCTLECRLHEVTDFGDGHFVVGEVLCWVVDTDVVDFDHPEGPHLRPTALNPLSKLGVDEWANLGTVFRLARPDRIRPSSDQT